MSGGAGEDDGVVSRRAILGGGGLDGVGKKRERSGEDGIGVCEGGGWGIG